MTVVIEWVITVGLFFCLIQLGIWLISKIFLVIDIVFDWLEQQLKMLKHRPSLWWQFHKKYESIDDPMLEINSIAILDMTEDECSLYLKNLFELRHRVYSTICFNTDTCDLRCQNSATCVLTGNRYYSSLSSKYDTDIERYINSGRSQYE